MSFQNISGYFKKNYDFFLAAAALVLGGGLLFSNLQDVIYLTEDEARPFTLMSSGQLMYLMNSLVNARFAAEDSAFYLAAGLAFLSIILFYILCRVTLGRYPAAFAALVYAVYPLRIEYARTLFPAPFMEPYLLLAVLFCYLGLSRRQSWWLLGAGASLACAFLVHYMAYAFSLGLAAAAGYFWFSRREDLRGHSALPFILKFTASFLTVFLLITQILKRVYHQDYFSMITKYYESLPYHKVKFLAFKYLAGVFLRAAGSVSSFLIAAAVLASIFFVARSFFKGRGGNYGFFLVLASVSAGVFTLVAVLEKHLISDRYLVWLVSFYSLCAGAAVFAGLSSRGRLARRILFLFFLGWIGLCVFESSRIVSETFKASPINAWIRENKIPKNLILCNWHIRESTDTQARSGVPVSVGNYDQQKDPAWFFRVRPRIAWPLIYRAYQKGLCGYIVTSGLDDLYAGLGDGDPMLRHVKPMAEWPHPYSTMPHRYFYRPGTSYAIRFYKLSDIFSARNFFAIKNFSERKPTLTP